MGTGICPLKLAKTIYHPVFAKKQQGLVHCSELSKVVAVTFQTLVIISF
jgi:hypothetical protein